jgi:hypothetical protein
MEELRRAAREALRRPEPLPDFLPAIFSPLSDSLHPLWSEISAHREGNHSEVRASRMSCDLSLIKRQTFENLLVLQGYLRPWGSRSLSADDEDAANCLYGWASHMALPSSVFAEAADLEDLPDGKAPRPVLGRVSNAERQAEGLPLETTD